MISRLFRFLGWMFIVFLIGGLGGMALDRVLLPRFETLPLVRDIPFLRDVTRGITIVQPTREVIVKESEALPRAIEKLGPAVVGILRTKGGSETKVLLPPKDEKITTFGSGIIITADGFVLTDADLILEPGNLFVVREERTIPATIAKLSLEKGLALLAIREGNLPVVSLIAAQDLSLGTQVFLLSRGEEHQDTLTIAAITAKIPSLTVSLLGDFPEGGRGAAVATTDGRVLGMARSAKNGFLDFVPAQDILSFLAESR